MLIDIRAPGPSPGRLHSRPPGGGGGPALPAAGGGHYASPAKNREGRLAACGPQRRSPPVPACFCFFPLARRAVGLAAVRTAGARTVGASPFPANAPWYNPTSLHGAAAGRPHGSARRGARDRHGGDGAPCPGTAPLPRQHKSGWRRSPMPGLVGKEHAWGTGRCGGCGCCS